MSDGTSEPRREPEPLPYDLAGLWLGAQRAAAVGIGVFAVAVVFGVLARQAGLSVLEALLMSALVFGGAAQFVALGLWTAPLPIGVLILTTLVVNLRHLLMSASLQPWLGRLPPLKAYGTLYFLVDESWALTIAHFTRDKPNGAFLLGSGGMLYITWVGGTFTGHIAGGVIADPARLGLDFAFTAVFLALLVGLWKGRSSAMPWVVAAVLATAAYHWIPGKWYILAGGIGGSLTGALRHAD